MSHHSRYRAAIAAIVVPAGLLALPSTAAADPVNSPGAQVVTQSCDGVEVDFVVRHAGRSDNLPASAHLLASTLVGRILWTDVEVVADGVVVDSFSFDWHHGTIGNGISTDHVVDCTNTIEMPDGITIYAHNFTVFPNGEFAS